MSREENSTSDRNPSVSSPFARSRTVASVEQFSRLPVWPAWNGALLFLVGRLFGTNVAAQLEDAVGGRVCPNFFSYEQTSPFVMLVHHRHTFAAGDPFRWLFQKLFLPEGFPAHPHRGFITLTYFLKGGFLHRDSMGIRQVYGAEPRHGGTHTQLLLTGAGLLHEEMFDMGTDWSSSQELYQLWINVPAKNKLDPPKTALLGTTSTTRENEEEVYHTPTVVSGTTKTLVLVGDYQGKAAACNDMVASDVAVFHVHLQGDDDPWTHETSHETVILYVRQGSVQIQDVTVPAHHTAYLDTFGGTIQVKGKGDFLFLSGTPLQEPIAAQGSMVMNTNREIQQAYADYQTGAMGVPWDHPISDDDWRLHVQQHPNRYHRGNVSDI